MPFLAETREQYQTFFIIETVYFYPFYTLFLHTSTSAPVFIPVLPLRHEAAAS